MSLVSSNKFISLTQKYFSRFDGTSVKTEPSSEFSHDLVHALGSYRNSPFVTGSDYLAYGLEHSLQTEILDYKERKWIQAKAYPFSKSGW